MNDQELLELAAKAAGLTISVNNKIRPGLYVVSRAGGETQFFDPLNDDGDALRLAVKLGLTIAPTNGSKGDIVEVYTNSGLLVSSVNWKAESHDGDPMNAVRRAIVLAAAEIEKRMQNA